MFPFVLPLRFPRVQSNPVMDSIHRWTRGLCSAILSTLFFRCLVVRKDAELRVVTVARENFSWPRQAKAAWFQVEEIPVPLSESRVARLT